MLELILVISPEIFLGQRHHSVLRNGLAKHTTFRHGTERGIVAIILRLLTPGGDFWLAGDRTFQTNNGVFRNKKMKTITCTLLVLCGVGSVLTGQEPARIAAVAAAGVQAAGDGLDQKACYVLGYDFVKNLQAQQADVKVESLVAGIKAALEGKEIGMSAEEIRSVLGAFEKKCNEKLRAHLAVTADANRNSGADFLKANSTKAEVQVLPSGLQYKVIQTSQGESPSVTDKVLVHYTGKLTNGEEFESTAGGQPVTQSVGGFIRGMTEALLKMKVGEKWELYIPSELAFGVQAPPEIGPNQVLIFELELVAIAK